MRIHVSHLTRYEYDQAVRFLPHYLYLRPREGPLSQMQHFGFTFSPFATLSWIRDDYDNLLACMQPQSEAAELEIQTNFEITTYETNPLNFTLKDYAANFPFAYEPLHHFNLTVYRVPPLTETQTKLREWLDRNFPVRPRETVSYLAALNEVVHRALTYKLREERGIQPSVETLRLGTGSCRDYAVLLAEIARTLGLAARFVSGYSYEPDHPPSAPGSMHAWVEIYLPGAGWKGLDPSAGLFCHDAYVPVAHAAVAESVNPVQGSYASATAKALRLSTQVIIECLD